MQVSVLTYNLGNGMADPRLLAQLLERSGVDLVGLQELSLAQGEELSGLYPYQALVPMGFSGKGLLSRYPIVAQELLELYPERPDLRCVVEIEGVRLQVLVAHPPPPRLRGPRLAFDTLTRSQLATLLELATIYEPSVLLGDLNMTPRNRLYAQFVAAGLVDAFARAGVGRGWTLPRRIGQASKVKHGLQRVPLRPVARVDYIWCTPGVRVESASLGDDAGSDHLPVIARLALST